MVCMGSGSGVEWPTIDGPNTVARLPVFIFVSGVWDTLKEHNK